MRTLKAAAAAAIIASTLLAGSESKAATFNFAQTSDDSTDGVLGGAGPYNALNYIRVTGDSTSTTISVFLDPTWSGIIKSGAGPASVSFGLSGVSSLDFQAITPGTFSTATGGVQVVGGGTPPLPAATQTGVLPTTLTASGKFSFAGDAFGLNVNTSGGANPLAPDSSGLTLSFTLTNLALTTFMADLRSSTKVGPNFVESACIASTANCFFLDVQKSANVTGLIDFGNPELVIEHHQGETPLPGALWLLGTVVGGGAGFGAWRNRKAKRAFVAA